MPNFFIFHNRVNIPKRRKNNSSFFGTKFEFKFYLAVRNKFERTLTIDKGKKLMLVIKD